MGDFLGIGLRVKSLMDVTTSDSVDCALDGIIGRSLGNGTLRAKARLEVDDVSGIEVVDETVDVNWLEGRVRVRRTTTGGG